MRIHIYFRSAAATPRQPVRYQRPLPHWRWRLRLGWRGWLLVGLLLGTNLLSHAWLNPRWGRGVATAATRPLYLLEEARPFLSDPGTFEARVRHVARELAVPPAWLMAVMYAESRFDASIENAKGSGAVGLIQFMPATAKELRTSTDELRRLGPLRQLDFVYRYLATARRRYGDFARLTDLYLAILYPKAIGQPATFQLYAQPSRRYRQNAGLDEDGDGRVTVGDINARMQRLFPTAYVEEP